MSRAATIFLCLSWALMQLPVVACTTSQGNELFSLLHFAEHECKEAERTPHCCNHVHAHASANSDFDSSHGEEEGDHTLIDVESSTSSTSTALFRPLTFTPVAIPFADGFMARESRTTFRSCRGDPPPREGPLARFDLLIV